MIFIANALVALVAALHVYFLILEMFLWTKPLGLKTFRQSPEKARDSAVLAANQGLYNGFLAAGLVGAGPEHPRLCVPNQNLLPRLRDRRRYLWSVERHPADPVRPGAAGRGRADPALPGLTAFTIPHLVILHCGMASSTILSAMAPALFFQGRQRSRPSA